MLLVIIIVTVCCLFQNAIVEDIFRNPSRDFVLKTQFTLQVSLLANYENVLISKTLK